MLSCISEPRQGVSILRLQRTPFDSRTKLLLVACDTLFGRYDTKFSLAVLALAHGISSTRTVLPELLLTSRSDGLRCIPGCRITDQLDHPRQQISPDHRSYRCVPYQRRPGQLVMRRSEREYVYGLCRQPRKHARECHDAVDVGRWSRGLPDDVGSRRSCPRDKLYRLASGRPRRSHRADVVLDQGG
jgi:hypothetical protein